MIFIVRPSERTLAGLRSSSSSQKRRIHTRKIGAALPLSGWFCEREQGGRGGQIPSLALVIPSQQATTTAHSFPFCRLFPSQVITRCCGFLCCSFLHFVFGCSCSHSFTHKTHTHHFPTVPNPRLPQRAARPSSMPLYKMIPFLDLFSLSLSFVDSHSL